MHTIALLRDNPAGESVRILATHASPDSPVLAVADVTEPEPDDDLTEEQYVQWALGVCERHGVDVVIPRLHAAAIAGARARFAHAGVATVVPPREAILRLHDKVGAYEDAARDGLPVPPYRVARTAAELLDAFDELERRFGRVCVKPVLGVGGEGFYELLRRPLALPELLGPLQSLLDVRTLAAALERERAAVPPLLVMPVLPGPEVSVDCLADADGTLLAAVPRGKRGYRRFLLDDPAATAIARSVVARHRLAFLSNTQVRSWQQPGVDPAPRPYLLETNPRASGGIAQTARAGVNLPWAAVELALGRRPAPLHPRLGASFTTVPTIVEPSGEPRGQGLGGEQVHQADVLVGDTERPRPR
ncbi:ATP-grasp domain-containing protein [uncultured Amnibacterium sp.]|uniref:ATP-grasp domain-containing protein n=1 Tax=uncultured Amnibacterium sp. TaxID=1631851 RepID=UPI0035CC95EB